MIYPSTTFLYHLNLPFSYYTQVSLFIIIIDIESNSTQSMDKKILIQYKHANCKKHRIKIRKMRDHTWTVTEQILYVQFLKKNWHLMDSIGSRKANKIFKRMADAIKTRTSIQAKSHHQKLQEKYKTIPTIISQVSNYIRESLLLESEKNERIQLQTKSIVSSNEGYDKRREIDENPLIQNYEDIVNQQQQRLFITSYCSFFDEYSENYGKIETCIIFDHQQLI